MPEATHPVKVIQFGVFEVDLRAGELRKQGLKIRLQEKPFQILAALLGHLASVFLRFSGGKGVATAFGISLVLIPKAALASFVIFFLVTWIWRYVSLGSLSALLTLPVWAALTGYNVVYLGLASVFALLVSFRHRGNIRALLQGNERKI